MKSISIDNLEMCYHHCNDTRMLLPKGHKVATRHPASRTLLTRSPSVARACRVLTSHANDHRRLEVQANDGAKVDTVPISWKHTYGMSTPTMALCGPQLPSHPATDHPVSGNHTTKYLASGRPSVMIPLTELPRRLWKADTRS